MSCFNLTKRCIHYFAFVYGMSSVVADFLFSGTHYHTHLAEIYQASVCQCQCVWRNGNFMERPIDCLIWKFSFSTMLLILLTLSPLNLLSFREIVLFQVLSTRTIPSTITHIKYTGTRKYCEWNESPDYSEQNEMYWKFKAARIH